MNKIADAQHPIADLIAKRWSPRAFSDKLVPAEKALSLFEAARWAPSAYNEQPWRFLVASRENPAEYAKMLSCLVEQNQVWAQNAPMLFVLVVKNNFDFDGKPNRWAMHDCGLAVENILLEAVNLGLTAHPMAGFSVSDVKEKYSVPEGYEPLVAVAVGYPGSPDALEGDMKAAELAPRERKPLSEIMFDKGWK